MEDSVLQMKYAFATVFVKRIIDADGVLHPQEEKYFSEWFPISLLQKLELDSPESLHHHYVRSLDVLPNVLTEMQKKELFGLLLGACLADDFLDFREFGILEAAARVLQIETEKLFELLDFFLDADIPSESDVIETDDRSQS